MSLQAISNNLPVLHDFDKTTFTVLKETLYPGAKDESIAMVLNYCKARKIDPLLKPVHLVSMRCKTGQKDRNGKDIYEFRDVVLPGIGLHRIDACRTGQYAGMSGPKFGKDVTEDLGNITITYPRWCKITVKRIVNGMIIEFTAKEYWKENYATISKDNPAPNAMWTKRAYGQLAKCTEAQALRKAFPDIIGQEYTAEEMEGKSFMSENSEQTKNNFHTPTIVINQDELKLDIHLAEIEKCNNLNELKIVFEDLKKKYSRAYPDKFQEIVQAKDIRKEEIALNTFDIDPETGEIL